MSLTEVQPRRWTRDEYYQMADLGFFQDQRVELIDGEIIEMPAQKDVHAVMVSVVHRVLDRAFGEAYWVRMQLPLMLPDDSEPEPDISVVTGSARDYLGKGHPRSALLVVEVSDTTLRFDRRRKASLYASAGIQDYWIANLIDMQVEVHRKPVADPTQSHGYRYEDVTLLKAGDSVASLAQTQSSISVSDLLP